MFHYTPFTSSSWLITENIPLKGWLLKFMLTSLLYYTLTEILFCKHFVWVDRRIFLTILFCWKMIFSDLLYIYLVHRKLYFSCNKQEIWGTFTFCVLATKKTVCKSTSCVIFLRLYVPVLIVKYRRVVCTCVSFVLNSIQLYSICTAQKLAWHVPVFVVYNKEGYIVASTCNCCVIVHRKL